MAKSVFNCFRKTLTCRKIDLKLRLRLTKAYIWSTLLYCCETWTITSAIENRLQAFEMWCYRRILRVSWTEMKRNEEILQMMGTSKCLLQIITKRQMSYFGHLARHSDIQWDILDGKVSGKKARGRQRQKWTDRIAKKFQLTQAELRREAQDRQRWRSRVAKLRIGDALRQGKAYR